MNNLLSEKKQNSIKTFLIAFVIGVVLSGIGIGYLAYDQVSTMQAKTEANKPHYSESVQWMIDHPQYAEKVKKSYDTYMKAAEDTFTSNLVVSESK